MKTKNSMMLSAVWIGVLFFCFACTEAVDEAWDDLRVEENVQALSGKQYDGTDPNSTGCANSAYTAKSVVIADPIWGNYLATVQLRYAAPNYNGAPSCYTAWARQFNNGDFTYPSSDWGKARVTRTSDGKTYRCTIHSDSNSCFTRQLWDGSGESAKACGKAWDPWGDEWYSKEKCTARY